MITLILHKHKHKHKHIHKHACVHVCAHTHTVGLYYFEELKTGMLSEIRLSHKISVAYVLECEFLGTRQGENAYKNKRKTIKGRGKNMEG